MKIDILTLFPAMFEALNVSILGRTQKEGILQINVVNIRDFSKDKHKKCDDYTFGGGAGLVMTPQPVCDAFRSLDITEKTLKIFLSPRGKTLNQSLVKQLAQESHLVLLCGHYEGIDQRAIDKNIDMEVSIGDYVLTGGELGAMVLVDAISRLVPQVLGNSESAKDETFENNLLEHSQYTRPQVFEGEAVPEVLLSGHHQNIELWRKQQRKNLTEKVRPDLVSKD